DVFRDRNLVSVIDRVRSDAPSLETIIPLSSWSDFLRSGAADLLLPDVHPNDVDQSDANVSYRRMRFGYARGPSDRGHPGTAPWLRPRTRAASLRRRTRYGHALRADDAHSHARTPLDRRSRFFIMAAGDARRGTRPTRARSTHAVDGHQGRDRFRSD